MNHIKIEIGVVNGSESVTSGGPTLALALGLALPELSLKLGDSRTFLGMRSFSGRSRSSGAFGLLLEFNGEVDPGLFNRYGTHQPIANFDIEMGPHIEAYDVYEQMAEIEGRLRYLAQDRIGDPKCWNEIRLKASEYQRSVSDVLIHDRKARIDLAENLDELFDGRDWEPWFPRSSLTTLIVKIGKIEIVERLGGELLIRFEYYNCGSCGRELEFVLIKHGRYQVRRDRFCALRSFEPAFSGWQLPQVHDALQEALDKGDFCDISETYWTSGNTIAAAQPALL